ncbi:MAG: flagellar assembly protein FliH [Ferrovum sp.]|nr:flagellar assembly protein FliH [Ferrovum sp.]NDU88075.1 flagellar assembly protein FliH [Ferrovum sp.]
MTLLSDSPLHSKDGLAAYQRWEFPSFDPVVKPVPKVPVQETPSLPPRPLPPTFILPTAAELEEIHQQAEQEGHRTGYQVGYQVGFEAGQQQVVQAVEHLTGVVDALQAQFTRVDQEVVQGVLDLALEVARQMLRQTLLVQPERILLLIREAMTLLPPFNQSAHLTLNPADALLVREAMGEQLAHSGWKIMEDMTLERGGCRFDTAHSQIDASLGRRWKEVVATLGQEGEWLA